MKFHRFDPYQDIREQKKKEQQLKRAARHITKDKWYYPILDPLVIAKAQRRRNIAMRAKRIKITLPMVTLGMLLLLTLHPQPAAACHHFSRWYYPTPQRCGYSPIGRGNELKTHQVGVRLSLPAPKKNYYVEVTSPTNDFPLPDLNGTWQTALSTQQELELWEEMQRHKALLLLSGE
jgi:hypothetical protein